ncbi:MAG: hypothetical protein ABEJ92_08445 [Halobacteriales archaeon]
MANRRLQAVVFLVVVLGLLQIFVEDVILFLGATGAGPVGLLDGPYLTMAVPLAISLLLAAVLVGGAILHTDSF